MLIAVSAAWLYFMVLTQKEPNPSEEQTVL